MEVSAKVMLSRRDASQGSGRRLYTLTLEREQITFLPLHWVVVHPITPESPLWEINDQAALDSGVECLILIRAIDETSSEAVHTRASCDASQFVWGARFDDIYDPPRDGVVGIDLRKLGSVSRVGLS